MANGILSNRWETNSLHQKYEHTRKKSQKKNNDTSFSIFISLSVHYGCTNTILFFHWRWKAVAVVVHKSPKLITSTRDTWSLIYGIVSCKNRAQVIISGLWVVVELSDKVKSILWPDRKLYSVCILLLTR